MNLHISQALTHLSNANYVGYFDEMDKVELPNHLQPIYATYKSQFMQGLKTVEFFQQLEVFAKEVDQQTTVALPNTAIKVVKVYDSPPRTWQSWLQKRRGRQDKTYWQCLAYTPLGYNQDDITKTLTAYLPPLTKEAQSKDEETLRKTYGLFEAEPDIENEFFNKNKRVLLLTGEVGTGKTTLMQKLFKQKAEQRVGKKIAFIYADQDTHAHIALAIAQGVQWLWIDAFDEDAQARQAQNEAEFLYRLKSLMEQVQGVERVLLSMRTEFLPEDDIQTDIFDAYSTCFVNLGLFAKPQILEHLTTHAYMRKENFVKALREQLHKNNIFLRPFLFSRAEEILVEGKDAYKQTPYAYTYQAYQKVVENWAGREQDKKKQEKAPNWVGFAGKVIEFCERVAHYFYEGRQAIHYKEIEQQRETLGLDLHDARNHALLVRDERGNYRFAHNVFLDYFIARNLLKGNIREEDLDKQKHKLSYDLYEEMCLGELANLPTQMPITSLRDLQNTPFDTLYFKAFDNFYIRALMIRYQKIFFQKELLKWHDILQEIDIQIKQERLKTQHYIWKDYATFEKKPKVLPNKTMPYYQQCLCAENCFLLYVHTHKIAEYNSNYDAFSIKNYPLTKILYYILKSPVCYTYFLDKTQIILENCDLSDLQPLSKLLQKNKKLQALNLEGNQISDISTLSNLNNLISLGLGGNQISDISPLSNLNNLKFLAFEGNNIKEIDSFLKLKKLKYLFLYGNPISDADIARLHQELPNTKITFKYEDTKPYLNGSYKIPPEIF